MHEENLRTRKSNLTALSLLQNNCLRRITRGYKRTPRAALEREAAIIPLDLYVKATALQRAAKVVNYPVERDIKTAVNDIWEAAQESVIRRVKGRGRPRRL